jgi:hypothetical protein
MLGELEEGMVAEGIRGCLGSRKNPSVMLVGERDLQIGWIRILMLHSEEGVRRLLLGPRGVRQWEEEHEQEHGREVLPKNLGAQEGGALNQGAIEDNEKVEIRESE